MASWAGSGNVAIALLSGIAGWYGNALWQHSQPEPDRLAPDYGSHAYTGTPAATATSLRTSSAGGASAMVEPGLSRTAQVPATSAGTSMPEYNAIESQMSPDDGAGDCESADDVGEAEQEQLQRAMLAGTDAERLDALQRLLSAGIEVPADLLLQMYTADPSEDVRLLAFTAYVDAVSSDPVAAREALLSGTVNSSAAVQAEARARLAEFASYQEQVAAAPPEQGVP